jgi:hypothetical protein
LEEIVCHATLPIEHVARDAFSAGDYSHDTLYVPKKALKAYRKSKVWGSFKSIQPIASR